MHTKVHPTINLFAHNRNYKTMTSKRIYHTRMITGRTYKKENTQELK